MARTGSQKQPSLRKLQRRQARRDRSDRRAKRKAARARLTRPHLCLVRAPSVDPGHAEMGREVTVATYNVHRWMGRGGRRKPDPSRAEFVLSELGADVIALQEVLRPDGDEEALERIADMLGLHLAFAATRVHRHGELGNAILSRWPLQSASTIDISHSRIERRSAVAARFHGPETSLAIIATHLSLVDRTRRRQVRALLGHPELSAGPAVLVGDMNAWRRCSATKTLDRELRAHHNEEWPASFPSQRPVLALDRVYARDARVIEVRAHDTDAARLASDHLPVVARLALEVD